MLVALGMGVSSCRETLVTRYASRTEADRAGAFGSGWLPQFLPPSAVDIWERHNIDTNETWGAFRFPAGEAAGLRGAVVPADPAATTVRNPGGTPEWPDALAGQLVRGRLHSAGLELFKAASEEVYLAVDWQHGVAYFWRTAR